MPKYSVLLGVAAYSLFVATLSADETAETILAKHIEAIGGLERIKNVRSARCTSKVWLNPGTEASVTLAEKWPFSSHIEYQFPNGPGRRASTSSPRGAADRPSDLQPPVEAVFDSLVAFALEPRGEKLQYLGHGQDEGSPALLLKLSYPDGKDQTYYIDPATFLFFKIVFHSPKPALTVVAYVGGDAPVDGLRLARREDFYQNGRLVGSVTNIQCVLNPVIDDVVFAQEPKK